MKFFKEHKKDLFKLFIMIGSMGIACLLLYQPMMKILENPQVLKQQLQFFGIFGQILFVGIMMLQVIFVFLPGEIVEVMAGFLYGPIYGMILCMIGSGIGSAFIYSFVKKFGIRFIDRLLGIEKINQVKFLNNKEKRNILCFIIFFIPGTPKDILTYCIPLTDMKLSTFLFITTIARIPSIITSTMSGYAIGMKEYTFSIIIFFLTGLISLLGLYIYKRINQSKTLSHL